MTSVSPSLHPNVDGPFILTPLWSNPPQFHSTSSILRCSAVTPWSSVLLGTLVRARLVTEFPNVTESITVSAPVDQFIATWNPSTSCCCKTHLTLFSHLVLGLPFGLLLSASCTKIFYAFLIYTRVLYIYSILLDLIVRQESTRRRRQTNPALQ